MVWPKAKTCCTPDQPISTPSGAPTLYVTGCEFCRSGSALVVFGVICFSRAPPPSSPAAVPSCACLDPSLQRPRCPGHGPHTSARPGSCRPARGPQCTRGSDRVLPRMLGGRDPGRPWQGRPGPPEPEGTPALPDPTLDPVWATGAAAGSLWRAGSARGRPLAAAQPLERRVRHGDGPPTGATQGVMVSALPATSLSQATTASP